MADIQLTIADSLRTGPYPLAALAKRWVSVIRESEKVREDEFMQWANEAMQFFDGPLNWMWEQSRKTTGGGNANGFLSDEGEGHRPTFLMSVNRLFEAVSLYGPVLYHQNPVISATPRRFPSISIDTMFAASPEALQVLSLMPQVEQGLVKDRQVIEMIQEMQVQYAMISEQQRQVETIKEDHAKIFEHYANWLQQESDKKSQARLAINEMIITGLGLMEIYPDQPPGASIVLPRSRYRCVKDLYVDPDAKYWKDVTWIALRTCAPVNQVEAKFGLPPGSLKSQYSSKSAAGAVRPQQKPKDGKGNPAGISHDLIEYWEVYSKNGAGQNLKAGKDKYATEIPAWLSELGDFVYLAVCNACEYPLNMSPDTMQAAAELDEQAAAIMEQIEAMEAVGQSTEGVEMPQTGIDFLSQKTAWSVPYWSDVYSDGGWPIVRLSVYDKPGQTWPISMCKACIGELRFINWCMSFLADGVAAGSKTYVAVMKEAAASIREQIMNSTGPFSLIELEKITGKTINELVQFLQAPSFNVDIWRMVAEVNEQIDKRLGLTELMYGLSSRQMRSAAEAQYRHSTINVRPDDMASRVEDWLSLVVTREMQCLRWVANYEDVLPVLGEAASQVFATQILAQDVEAVTREFAFRIEAGSARKPNKDTKIAQLNDLSQYLLPTLTPLAINGVIGPFNAFMKDLGSAMEMDSTPYLLTPEDSMALRMLQMPPEPAEESNASD